MQCVSRIKQQLGNGRPPHFCQLLVQSEPNAAGTAALAPSVVPDETLAVDLEQCRSLMLNLRSFSQFLREIFTAPGQPTPAIIGAAVQVHGAHMDCQITKCSVTLAVPGTSV